MRQGVLLSEAPDLFFDRDIWTQIQAYAGQRYNALAMLNAPVPERQGDDFWGQRRRPQARRACFQQDLDQGP
jgi:hypothetical protein